MFTSILAKLCRHVGKIFCVVLITPLAIAAQWQATLINPLPTDVENAPKNMRELGGLAYDPASQRYYAVSDIEPSLFSLHIEIDLENKTVRARATGSMPFRDKKGPTGKQGLDREGLAWMAGGQKLLASIESMQRVLVYRASDAQLERIIASEQIPGLRIHTQKIHNRGWESIAYRDGQLWLLNEQALRPDRPRRGAKDSALHNLRLQRYDYQQRKVSGQWAYPMHSWPRSFVSTHGVSAIEVLPDGQLLVLERAVELNFGIPIKVIRHRLFLADISEASDTSKLPTLIDRPHKPIRKQLLWEQRFGQHNFEGMSFGPELGPNSLSLVLISDNGGGLEQSVLAFKLERQQPSLDQD